MNSLSTKNPSKKLTISKAADFLGVSPKTLRRWEDAGLIKPSRNTKNQRTYTTDQLLPLLNRKHQPLPNDHQITTTITSSDPNYLSISQAAEALDVSVKTVRRWDEQGIINTQRNEKNHRIFSAQEINRVKKLKQLGQIYTTQTNSNPANFTPQNIPVVPAYFQATTTTNNNKSTIQQPQPLETTPQTQTKSVVIKQQSDLSTQQLPTTQLPNEPINSSNAPPIHIGQKNKHPRVPSGAFSFLGAIALFLVLFGAFNILKPQKISSPSSLASQGSTKSDLFSNFLNNKPVNPNQPKGIITSLGNVLGITTNQSDVSFDAIIDANFNFGVTGTIEGSQLISSTTTGAPLVISSPQRVPNLNADLLDGKHLSEIEAEIQAGSNLQAAYDNGSTINANGSDLVLNFTNQTVDADFKINLLGNQSTLNITGNSGENIFVIDPQSANPVTISKATNITQTLTLGGNLVSSSTLNFDDNNTPSTIPLSDASNTTLPAGKTSILDALADIGTGGGLLTDSGSITYLTSTSDDFAIGGSSLSVAFSVDTSENKVRIGNGSSTDGRIELFASDGDTGTLTYTTSDEFNFSGGNVVVGQDLSVSGGDISGSNGEAIHLGTTDDIISFTGSGGSNDTDLYINLDGSYPTIYSAADTAIGIDDDITFIGAQTISSTTGNITISPSGSFVIANLDCTGNSNGGALTADASGVISCSDDDSGSGAVSVEEGDAEIVATLSTLDFFASDFTITNSPSGEANIVIDYTNSGITRNDQSETISTNWTFSAGLTLGNDLTLSTNNIITGAATISSAELDILDGGILLSELTDTGTLTASSVNIDGGTIDGTTIGGSTAAAGTFTDLTTTGITSIGDGGDAITLSGSSITLAGFTGCTALETDGSGVLACGSDDSGAGSTWVIANQVVRPVNTSLDLVIGGTATASATYQVFASTGASTQSGSLTFSGGNTIQSTSLETLTLGGSTTGNIVIDSGSGSIALSDNTAITGTLSVTGASDLVGDLSDSGGDLTIADNTVITGTLDLQGALSDSNSSVLISDDLEVSGTTGLTFSGAGSDISFTGGGTNTISSSGTLELGALTLTGAVTGNSQDLTGLGSLTVDNVRLDGNTLDTTSGNLTIDSAGGTITITDAIVADGGSITRDGGNLALSTTTSGNISFSSVDDIFFTDTNVTNIPLTIADTQINAALTQGIIDAINDVYDLASGGGGSSAFWSQSVNGALFPNNSTVDVTIGGQSTASAAFAFKNINSGVRTATISGGATGGTYLTANGNLATTTGQSLTLGGSTTGDLILQPNGDTGDYLSITSDGTDLEISTTDSSNLTLNPAGNLNFFDTTNSLDSSGNLTLAGTLTVNGDQITADGATLTINAGGTVDIQDSLTVDSITTDTGGISIATGQSYTGAGSVTLSSGGGGSLTLDAASGTINIAASDTLTNSTWSLSSAGVGSGFTQFNVDNLRLDGDTISNTSGALYLDSSGADGDRIVFKDNIEADGAATISGLLTAGSFSSGSTTLSSLTVTGTSDLQGDVSDSLGDFTIADNAIITGTLDLQGVLSDSDSAVQIGDDLEVSGTTGLTFTGSGANLSFTGGGTNTISSSGTLEIGAHTLTGAITGNSQDITGLGSLTVDNLSLDANTLSATSGFLFLDSSGADGDRIVFKDNIEADGAATISGSLIVNGSATFNGALALGDGGDTIAINGDTWDISSAGVGSGFTQFTVDNLDLNGDTFSNTSGFLYLDSSGSDGDRIVFKDNIEADGSATIAGTLSVTGTSDFIGDISDSAGDFTIADNAVITGTLNIQGILSDSDSALQIVDDLDITGSTTLGDGGSTNYATFSSTGDLTFTGSADTITGPGASGLTLTNTGGNLAFTTATSGDLVFTTAGNFTLTGFTDCTALETDGSGNLSCGVDDGDVSIWVAQNQVIHPGNTTLDLVIGGTATSSATFQIFADTGASTQSGNLTFSGGNTIQTTQNQSLTLGGSTTGDISLAENTSITGTLDVSSDTTLTGALTANGTITLGDGGDSIAIDGDTWDIDTAGAGTGFTSFVVDSLNLDSTTIGLTSDTDLLSLADNALTINGSGTFTSDLTLNAQSDLRLADSDSSNYIALQAPSSVGSNITYTFPGTITDGYILQTDGSGALTWADPAALAGASTLWSQANGTIYPKNTTADFLVGGQASSSAAFSILNVLTGTPTASVSAGANGATYLTADGTLQTTNDQLLTIGGDTTGNISLADNTSITGTLTVSSTSDFVGNIADSGGDLTIDDNAIITGTLDLQGTLSDSDSAVQIADDLEVSGTTGLTFTGSGANLSFTGGGTNTISSSGTLEIGAHTLTGAITGNSQNITGLALLQADNLQLDGDTLSNTSGALFLDSSAADGDRIVFKDNIEADGAATIAGTLDVADDTNLAALTISGTGTFNGQLVLGDGGDSIAINGDTWDIDAAGNTSGLTIGTTQLSGTLFTSAGDTGSTAITQGDTLTIAGGTNITSVDNTSGTITLNLDGDVLGLTNLTVDNLDLNGNTVSATSGFLYLDSSGSDGDRIVFKDNIEADGAATISGLLTAGSFSSGATTLSSLTVTGTSDLQGDVSDSLGDFTIADNAVITGTLDLQGTLSDSDSAVQIADDLEISGTTGLTFTGSGSDITFSGGGTNTISSSGTLEIGAFTLTGAVTGNSQNITGLALLQADNLQLDGDTLSNTSGALYLDSSGADGDRIVFKDNIEADGAATVAGTLDVSGTTTLTNLTANGVLVLGDGGDSIAIDGDTWDISSAGAGTGFTSFVIDSLNLDGTTIGLTSDTDLLSLADNALTVNGSSTFTSDLTLNAQSDLRLADSDSSNYIALQAPSSVSTNITYTLPGTITDGYVLQTNSSGDLTWADPAALAGASTFWDQANGTLYPKNTSADFLVGGQASSSAAFSILNVLTGTPTASVSAGANGATYLTANGTLQTTNDQLLTIGGNTTGNISLADNTSITGTLSVSSTSDFIGNIADSGGDLTIDDNAVITGTLDLQGILSDSDSAVQIGDDLEVSGTTGLTFTGSGANLSFTGGGTNTISSSGTLEIGAYTLTGAITGNSQNITGLAQLTVDNLDLNGDTLSNTSGFLYLDSSGADGDRIVFKDNLEADGAATIAGTLNVSADSTLANLIVTGTSDLQGNVSDSLGDFTIADNAVVTGTLDAQGNISDSLGDLTLDDATIITGTLDLQGVLSDSNSNLQIVDDLDITGSTTLGDGGSTNYATFNSTGDLTFTGSADTITGAGAAGLTITNASGDLNLATTTSGEIDLTSAGLIDINASANLDIDITGTFDVLSSGAFSIDGTGASNLTATSGNLTLSTVTSGDVILTTAGNLTLTGFDSCTALETDGSGNLSCGSDDTGASVWNVTAEVIHPGNTTLDLVIGGTATSSATYQVFADTGASTQSGSLTFSGGNQIQTTSGETLTLGGDTTGNLNLNPNGETDNYFVLQSDGTDLTLTTNGSTNLTLDAGGTLSLGATTLTGAITGNGQNITGLAQLTVDNLSLDGNTLSSSTGDVVVAPVSTSNLDVNVAGGGEIQLDGGLTNIGTGTFTLADGDNDLGVEGDTEINGALQVDGAATFNGTITLGDGGDTIAINGDTWDISSAGVGSGFTQFDVDNLRLDGDTLSNTSGALFLDSSAADGDRIVFKDNIEADGAATVAGTLDVSGDSTLANLTVTGTSDLQGNVSDSGGDLTLDDNTVVTGTLDAQGNISDSGGDLTLDDAVVITGTLDIQGILSDSDSDLQIVDNVDITGITSLGDGGSTNYAAFSATGDLTFNGSADTITGPGAAGLTITNASGDLNLATTTSGEIDLTSAGLIDVNAGANLDIDITGTFDVLSSGAFSIDGTGASNLTATSGNLTLSTATSGDLILTTAGNLTLTGFNSCTALETDGSGNLSCGTDDGGTSYWDNTAEVIHPGNTTLDLVIGGTATSSATYQVFADTGASTQSGNLTFSGGNRIQTTSNQSLIIGGNTTGDVAILERLSLASGDIIDNPSNGIISFTGVQGTIADLAFDLDGTVPEIYSPNDSQIRFSDDIIVVNGSGDSAFATNVGSLTVQLGDIDDASNSVLFSVSDASQVIYTTGANFGISDSTPDARLEVLSTTEQLRLSQSDDTNDARFTVDSNGDLTINVSGGQLLLADSDVINIGGVSGLGYNAISDSGTTSHSLSTDDDLYIEGTLEVDSASFFDADLTIATDLTVSGGDITGANSAAIDLGEASSGDIQFYASGDTSDFIYFDTTSNIPTIFFERATADTNDSGIRLNTSTNQLEYSDQDSGSWVAFDDLGGGGTTYWDLNSTILNPGNTTLDLVIGGNSTASAKLQAFAQDGSLGINSTTTNTTFAAGSLVEFDWSPGSTTTSTDDLLSLNVGSNGTLANIFNVKDNDTSVFSVSQSQITSALPHQFTAAGDVSMAYDLNLTNQTSSSIKSNGPLTVEAGESFESNNLTLKTYNSGEVVFDTTSIDISGTAASIDFSGTGAHSISASSGTLDITANTASISGALAVGVTYTGGAGTCDASSEGQMFYDKDFKEYYFCNGTDWLPINNNIESLSSTNLIKNYPSLESADGTQPDWWEEQDGNVTLTEEDATGESIPEKHARVLKVVNGASGANKYVYQTFRSNDVAATTENVEPLLDDNNTQISAGVWVYTASAGTITLELYDAGATASLGTASTTTTGSWVYLQIDDKVFQDQTQFRLYHSANSATFYAAMPQFNIGDRPNNWNERGLVYREVYEIAVSAGSPGSFADVDVSSLTSGLATQVSLSAFYINTTATNRDLIVRRNGATNYSYLTRSQSTSVYAPGFSTILVDDQQIFEYGASTPADTDTAYIYLDGFWEWESSYSGGADVAEWYATEDSSIGPGDIVSIDPSNAIKVKKSSGSKDPLMLGVVTTQPGLLLGDSSGKTPGYDDEGGPFSVPVALTGRIPVRIDPNSPAINIGDYLTSSSIPGKATKALGAGPIIAKALEPYIPGSAQTSIMAFLQVDSAYAPISLTDLGEIEITEVTSTSDLLANLPQIETTTPPSKSSFQIIDSLGKIISEAAIYSNAIIANLKTGFIQTQTLVAQRFINTPALNTNTISPLADNNLTIDLTNNQEASDSADFGTLIVKGNASVSGQLTADSATISGDLVAYDIAATNAKFGDLVADSIKAATISAETIEGLDDQIEAKLNNRLALLEQKINQSTDTDHSPLTTENSPSLPNPTASNPDHSSLTTENSQDLDLTIPQSTSSAITDHYALNTKHLSDIPLSTFDDLDSTAFTDLDALLINDFLAVTGTASIVNLEATNYALIGGNLLADHNSISTLDSCHSERSEGSSQASNCDNTLYLQPTGGNLSLVANLMTLDQSGQVIINGNLTVNGDLAASTLKTTQLSFIDDINQATPSAEPAVLGTTTNSDLEVKLATNSALLIGNFDQATDSASLAGQSEAAAAISASGSAQFATIKVTSNSGQVTIDQGRQGTIIQSTQLTPESQVIVTFEGDFFPATRYWINKDTATGIFSIQLDRPVGQSVKAYWLIIN